MNTEWITFNPVDKPTQEVTIAVTCITTLANREGAYFIRMIDGADYRIDAELFADLKAGADNFMIKEAGF